MEVSKGSEYIHTPALQKLLWEYVPTDATEKGARAKILDFIEHSRQFPWDRENFSPGHITASAWVVDEEGKRVLLVNHKTLGKWLQPGGHIEAGEDIFGAALREVKEETGLSGTCEKNIFDIDVHPIPSRSGEAGHTHFDIRVLVRVKSKVSPKGQVGEGDVKWVDIDSVSKLTKEESIARMVRKTKTTHI